MSEQTRPLADVLAAIEALLRLARVSAAQQMIAAVARTQPDLVALHLLRGWCELSDAQPERAVVAFRLAAGRDPTDPLVWYGIAETSADATERAAAAERAALLSPDDTQAQLWHDLHGGKPHLAVTPLHAAVRRHPDRVELAIWLAEAHRRLGNQQQAAQLIDPLLRRRPRPIPAIWLAAALTADGLRAQTLLLDALRFDPLGSGAQRLFGPELPFILPAAPEIALPASLAAELDELAALTPLHQRSSARRVVAQAKHAKAADLAAAPHVSETDHEVVAALSAMEQATQRLLGRTALVAAQQQSAALLVWHRAALAAAYDAATADAIGEALTAYAAGLAHRGVQAQPVAIDERDSLATFGSIPPAAEASAAACKHTIDQLHMAINATGRTLDAVVLIGGDGVIPFHRLANPSQDADPDVPSDNPYGCGAGSELAPELIIARFPDGGADGGRLLLDQLERAAEYHQTWQFGGPSGGLLGLPLMRRFTRAGQPGGTVSAWGVSAEVWALSSQAVFDELGSTRPLALCPPATPDALATIWPTDSRVLYFNLHGLPGGPNWYGQAAGSAGDAPLPVALTPDTIDSLAPGVICISEACFGGQISGRSAADAVALRMLQRGASAVLASTVTAYGAVALPLGGADLLVQQTLQQLRRGHPLGQAVALARDWMAREMIQRQGYLDPDDAKTLLSFVLLGDPWATPYLRPVLERKTMLPQITPVVVQRRPIAANLVAPAASTVARQLIAKVAPGLARATLSVVGQGRADRMAKGQASAVVFSASEALPTTDGRTLAQIARVTVAGGEARKLLLSR